MATPAKVPRLAEPEDNLVGFVHNVSQFKLSKKNVRYFNAELQTGREEYRRVVCFSAEKRCLLLQADENGQPVKIRAAKKTISFSDPGGFDILVSAQTQIEATGPLEFSRRAPRTTATIRTVAEVLSLGPRQRIGEVEVRVVQATGSRVVPMNGRPTPLEVRSFEICDSSGQTLLHLWDRSIVEVEEGRSYRIQGLATRKEGDRTVLTSTPDTTITRVADIPQPSSLVMPSAAVEKVVSGEVTGVQVRVTPRCRRCHGSQDNVVLKNVSHRCQRCGILQRTTAYTLTYGGLLIVVDDSGEETSMTLTNSSVFLYVRDNVLTSIAHDGQALEENIFELKTVQVTTDGQGLVVRIVAFPATSNANSASSVQDTVDGLEEVFVDEI